jgi:hypothetical protein
LLPAPADCQGLTLTIRSFQAAEIRALAWTCAGDEEGHGRGLRRCLLRLADNRAS